MRDCMLFVDSYLQIRYLWVCDMRSRDAGDEQSARAINARITHQQLAPQSILFSFAAKALFPPFHALLLAR